MERKKYEKPKVEIIHFETEDVIMTSGCHTAWSGGDSSCYETLFDPIDG